MKQSLTITMILACILVGILTGCGSSVVMTGSPYEDGDTEIDGDVEDTDTDTNPLPDGDVESTEDIEDVEDGDAEYTEDTEDGDVEEDPLADCYAGSRLDTTCEALQGTCSEGQICARGPDEMGYYYCIEYNGSSFYAPSDNPDSIEAPDGYGPDSLRDVERTQRWLERCTNERDCNYKDDGPCCAQGFGFWYVEGTMPPSSGTIHYNEVCNADHEVEVIVRNGHCYIESEEDENGETTMQGYWNGWNHPTNPCLYCNSDIDPYDWTPRPDGILCEGSGQCEDETGNLGAPCDWIGELCADETTTCVANSSTKICTEDGECLVPEEEVE